jgi:hypothetical protein
MYWALEEDVFVLCLADEHIAAEAVEGDRTLFVFVLATVEKQHQMALAMVVSCERFVVVAGEVYNIALALLLGIYYKLEMIETTRDPGVLVVEGLFFQPAVVAVVGSVSNPWTTKQQFLSTRLVELNPVVFPPHGENNSNYYHSLLKYCCPFLHYSPQYLLGLFSLHHFYCLYVSEVVVAAVIVVVLE